MSRSSIFSSPHWLSIARAFALVWIVFSVVLLFIDLPIRFERLRSLDLEAKSGEAFFRWDKGQIQSALADSGIQPEAFAGVIFSAKLICLTCFWVVGGLLFWRRSDTTVGLLTAIILFLTGPGFSGLLLNQSHYLPWIEGVYSLSAVLVFPTFFVFLYLFPNGKFAPRFTRYLAPLPFLLFAFFAFIPENSIFVAIGTWILIAYALGGLISQVYRHRRLSTAEERQQTKWVVFALGIFLVSLILTFLTPVIFPALIVGTPASFWNEFLGNGVTGYLIPALIPFSLGVSILRYRLWDIDVIIRRTLVYGAITVTLALIYFGSVTLLQTIISSISNQQSAISNVISTLFIAAIFNPLRRRIQTDIDRRFFRKKYDAQKTLEGFAAQLRNEVELEQLSTHLVAAVQDTLQPESVSLWLKQTVSQPGQPPPLPFTSSPECAP